MFNKILIANRGEIACRVMKTCRRLGIRTVAVYSEADANARHVRLADEAICVGPAASRDSYLRADRILEAAKTTGAQAVHPGYGFLSENEGFAEACAAAGIVFIGPPVAAIRAMGSKSAAKALMAKAGVPLVPGYHGDEQAPDFLRKQADGISYPVLIKASAGGGGKGMRVVERSEDFEAALASCQREARASFGDDRVLIEKYLQRPRHIEIQVFGDTQGEVVSLYERDCSSQRRHQKVIEEAPAPGMSLERRAAMGKAACDAARAVGYVGAGTVEFIVDQDGSPSAGSGAGNSFFFMEMNTRLQVEHPVTEMITGLDLVEWQLRVAAGEPLPLKQHEIPLRGHAIEVRVYAEEPEKGFLPSIGRLEHFVPPSASMEVRIDSGVEQNDEISPHYDPMIAKLIVHDETRAAAIERMLSALAQFRIVGVGNNIRFLSKLVGHAEFREGRVDTGLIEREREVLQAPQTIATKAALAAATLWLLREEGRRLREQAAASPDPHSPWAIADGWRVNRHQERSLSFFSGDVESKLLVTYGAQGSIALDGEPARIDFTATNEPFGFHAGALHGKATVVARGEQLHVFLADGAQLLTVIDPLAHAGETQDAHGGLVAPMPGKIIALLAAIDADIEKGAPLLVMEAMKMEHTLCAPAAGKVRAFLCAVGEQVGEGLELIDFEKREA